MDARAVVSWMLSRLAADGCLYQDDVVDYLVKNNGGSLLRENSDGNLAVGAKLLKAFRLSTETNVVWVKPDFYWRWRVAEDDTGREARG